MTSLDGVAAHQGAALHTCLSHHRHAPMLFSNLRSPEIQWGGSVPLTLNPIALMQTWELKRTRGRHLVPRGCYNQLSFKGGALPCHQLLSSGRGITSRHILREGSGAPEACHCKSTCSDPNVPSTLFTAMSGSQPPGGPCLEHHPETCSLLRTLQHLLGRNTCNPLVHVVLDRWIHNQALPAAGRTRLCVR